MNTPTPYDHSYDKKWDTNYNTLKEFHKTYGHTKVPTTHPLYKWLCNQRRCKIASRIKLLNDIRVS